MSYEQTAAEVLEVSVAGSVTTMRLRLSVVRVEPLAPAGLWRGADAAEEAWQLHRLVERAPDGSLVFETYDGGTPPEQGERFVFQSWWTPRQFEAARDQTPRWERAVYSDGDHEHCLLTWHTIMPGDHAYHSSVGWLSVDAYQRFIRGDVLRLRTDAA